MESASEPVRAHTPSPQALLTALGLMRGSPLPMVLWWGPDLEPHCNEAYMEVAGAAERTLQPAHWGAAWPGMSADIERVRSTGTVVWHDNLPLPLPRHAPNDYRGTFSYNPVLDGEGVSGVLCIFTRHYRASQVQADGRFGYAAVIHSMDVGFAIVEALDTPPGELLDYRYVEVNHAWVTLTGFANVQGKRITELVSQREPFWPELIRSVVETGVPVRTTEDSPAFGRVVDVYAMRLGAEGSRQVALLVQDVTAETRGRAALQQSEQRARAEADRAQAERNRLDAVLEATPAPVFVVDAQGRFISANSRARKEWGTHPQAGSQQWMGWWADGSARHGQRVSPREWSLSRALRGEVSRDLIEIASPTDARQRRTYLISGAPIRGQDSQVEGAVVAAMDITDRVRAEEALKEAHQRKDEFLAMLAHELRNPLAPIRAAAELMSRPKAGKELMLRTSAIIARQVQHMTGLVDDLLDMSRVNRGTITLDKELLDTDAVIDGAIEQVSPQLRLKRHRLDLDLPDRPVLFGGDRKRVIQVLSNLLNNAIKYTPEGGHLRLSMALVGEHLEIRVRDNGVGMDAQTLERAFDLFAQAHRTSDRQQGGLGIGLALVKKLVELHGGQVQALSEGPGQGSEFVVRLPATADVQAPPAQGESVGSSARESLSVMVVDDHVDAATTLSMLIEAEGYSCTVVHHPEQALSLARQQPPDVYVLDIGLPGMDGRELARHLRASPGTASALLVGLSGYARPEDRQAALDAGFDHYLVKPVDSVRLLQLLAEQAEQRRQAPQVPVRSDEPPRARRAT